MLYSLNKAKITKKKPEIIVCDDFYEDPDYVRDFALKQKFEFHPELHKGSRTEDSFIAPGTKERFEELLGRKIVDLKGGTGYVCGVFQYCIAEDKLVIHTDTLGPNQFAAIIYLTPNAPPETGTSFYQSKKHKIYHQDQINSKNDPFKNNFYDFTPFELVDTVGNRYNRLIIFNGGLVHSSAGYFGASKEDSRLFHIFFFDTK